jgi:bisphosphoglycerate-dependent phosphoglycerate mutase
VPLTTLGKNEAAQGATQMWKDGYQVDVAFTSLLKRAQQTLAIVLKITGQEDVPVHQNWRLNERMYGGLTGLNKKETVAKYGVEQVGQWRRSYDTPRTRLAARTRQSDLGAQRPTAAQLRHAACAPRRAQRRRSKRTANTGRATTTSTRTSPRLTSLSQSVSRIRCAARALGRWRRWAPGRQWWAWCVRAHPWRSRRRAQVERCLPYWETSITPALKRGKTCLIAAHGNSIRGMLKCPQLAPPPPPPEGWLLVARRQHEDGPLTAQRRVDPRAPRAQSQRTRWAQRILHPPRCPPAI